MGAEVGVAVGARCAFGSAAAGSGVGTGIAVGVGTAVAVTTTSLTTTVSTSTVLSTASGSLAQATAMVSSRAARTGPPSLRTTSLFISMHAILFGFALCLKVRIRAKWLANYGSADLTLPLRARRSAARRGGLAVFVVAPADCGTVLPHPAGMDNSGADR